jgi:hypothetical protein
LSAVSVVLVTCSCVCGCRSSAIITADSEGSSSPLCTSTAKQGTCSSAVDER